MAVSGLPLDSGHVGVKLTHPLKPHLALDWQQRQDKPDFMGPTHNRLGIR